MAESLQLDLYPDVEAAVGVANDAGLAGSVLAAASAAAGFEAAVLVVTVDDLDRRGEKGRNTRREDFVFALGFLLGRFGKERTFLVTVQDLGPRLPPDLAGIEPVAFAIPEDGDLLAATDALCTRIKQAVSRARS